MGRHRTPAELAAIRGKQIRGRDDNAGNRIDPTTMGVVRHGGAGMPIRDTEAPRHPSLWPIEYSGWSRSAVARTVRDMFSSDEFQSSPDDHARNEAVQSAQIQRSRNRSRSPIAGTSRNVISADSDGEGQDITDHDLGIMQAADVTEQDVQALAATGTGTGGNAGDQNTMKEIAVPVYRNLNGNIHGFTKRWFFILPVVNPSIVSTTGGGGPNTRNLFYMPGAFDFDPNYLGWYATGGTMNVIKRIADQGFSTCKVKSARMVGQITAINSPFNTQATNQGTANGQLHLTGFIGRNLNRAGLTVVGTCRYTSQQAGSHNITTCNFDNNAVAGRTWFEDLERTTVAGTADPNTTSGIYVLSQTDATEGYRYYPQQFGYKCEVKAGRVVENYADYMRDCSIVTVGPGPLFELGGKRNAFLGLQAYNQDIPNQMYTGIGTNTVTCSSFDGQQFESLGQRTAGFASLNVLSRIVDNNATHEAHLQMTGPTLKPSFQFGMLPAPTTTDTVTTAQVAYVQVVVDTQLDVEFMLDHYKAYADVTAGDLWPRAQLLNNTYKWSAPVRPNGNNRSGLGNGIIDSVERLQRSGNCIMEPANNLANVGP